MSNKAFSEGFTEDIKKIIKDCIDEGAIGVRIQLSETLAIAIHIMDFPGLIEDGKPLPREEPEADIQLVH